MSLLDDVSIVVTPNGYKAGTLYGVIPSDGAADMDVTRATDATRVDENGLIADVLSNVPRIDYTGGGCPHILAEPQRTNLVIESEDFEDASYGEYLVSYTPNFATSPSGESNATKLTSSGVYGNINLNFTKATSAITYTQSIFIKPNNYTLVNFISYGASSSNRSQVTFDLSNGTISSAASSTGAFSNASATITSYTNDYYKISLTYTTDSSAQVRPTMSFPVEMDSTNYVIIWGMTLEEGSYATSYIPTSGSTVTRNQDIFTRDGIGSLIGQTEGTFFIELSKPTTIMPSLGLITLNNAASNSDRNSVAIGFFGSDDFFLRVQSENVSVFSSSNIVTSANTFYKVAISYKSGESLIYVDGSPVTPNQGSLAGTFTFDATLDNLSFDYNGNNVLPFYGKVKQLQVYKTALTDVQLAALTS